MGGSAEIKHREMTDIKDLSLTYLCLCSVLTDSLRRTRLILLVLLLLGIYGLSRTPFLSGKGSFSDAGLFQFYSFPCLQIISQPYMHTANGRKLVSKRECFT